MNQSTAVEIKDLSKQFIVKRRQSLLKGIVRLFGNDNSHQRIWALRKVSFNIRKGKMFGIIGPNGAGKTTLLKIIAGIFRPTAGQVRIMGEAIFFFQWGLGFHPDLTVRENIYLYAAFLGMGRDEVNKKFEEIINFAQLSKYVDLKLSGLSYGMELRLAFAIARQTVADIYVFDEIFAAGDLKFRQKVKETFGRFKQEGKTVIFASNTLSGIEEFCDRCAYLDKGRLIAVDKTETVVAKYRSSQ